MSFCVYEPLSKLKRVTCVLCKTKIPRCANILIKVGKWCRILDLVSWVNIDEYEIFNKTSYTNFILTETSSVELLTEIVS